MITVTYQNIHTHSQVHLNKETVPKIVDNAIFFGMHTVLSIEPGISVIDLFYTEGSFVQIKNISAI